ncbi:MAG: AraC family transcriptional regulator ligand-binding domain-containing protein [Actinomycetota bacterium]
MSVDTFGLDPAVKAILIDLGVSPDNVLRRAGLPADLFARGPLRISQDDFFALWRAIEAEAEDPNLPLRLVEAFSPEVFEPAIFAALLSPNLNVAARRVATYKRLIGPVVMTVDADHDETTIGFEWPGDTIPPASMVLGELLFWVAMARTGTRERIQPVRVVVPRPPTDVAAYRRYLGVTIGRDDRQSITFSAEDASRAFLMANEAIWEAFEPSLRTRLADIEPDDSHTDRVRAALVELLPSGSASRQAVAGQLAVSTRTLQRRLSDESTTFQEVLATTRESLARHYLRSTSLAPQEISFLLGYEEPSSFYRAFQQWTGTTPERLRATHRR